MHYKPLTAAVFAAAALLTVAGCSSNQSLKTTDGRIRLNRWMNWITKRYLWPREEYGGAGSAMVYSVSKTPIKIVCCPAISNVLRKLQPARD